MKIFNIVYFIFTVILLIIVIIQNGFVSYHTLVLGSLVCVAGLQLNLYYIVHKYICQGKDNDKNKRRNNNE